ncbi:MAG: cell division protein ZapB [Spirochaetota bacterium]
MVTIEQIRLLDKKVHSAVERIGILKQENQSLKSKLEHYEGRISELERLIESFKQDQGEIERGITNALDELNRLEDDLDETSSASEDARSETDTEVGVTSEEDSPSPSPSIVQTEEEPQEVSEEDADQSSDEDDSQTGELDIF